MKGMVFTEFLDFVEEQFGLETVDKIVKESKTGGAYTSVGTYPHEELAAMLGVLSSETKMAVPELLSHFGKRLFSFLVGSYPEVVGKASDSFQFLAQVENHIHVEVRKLYPDSELPEFEHEFEGDHCLRLTYRSDRGFADLAEGLLHGCFDHFDEDIAVARNDLSGGECKLVEFTLVKQNPGSDATA